METNRIAFSSVLAAKTSSAKAGAANSGFADMLMGVMNHHLAQTESAPAKATTTYTPRRRFDDYPTGRVDFRDAGDTRVDRRIQNDQSNSRWSVGDDSTNPGRGIVHRASATGDHPAHVGCGQVPGQEADAGDIPVEPADGIDGTMPEQPVDTATSEDLNLGDAETSADGEQQPDQSAEPVPTSPLAVTMAPVETIEDGIDVVPAAASSETDETAPTAPIDAASGEVEAVTPLLDLATTSAPAPQTAPSADGSEADDTDAPEAAKAPVTFASALALGNAEDGAAKAAQSQVNATTRKNEQELEEATGSFRRSANARRAGAASQGTTAANGGSHPQQAAQNSEIHVPAAANSGATSTPAAAPYGTTVFDGGLGSVTGVPGWNLHLAQGAAVKRADFVANLRQHLQNLPVHEQVALSIQKSAKDGVGSITLQLSPSELGRIHLKLEIDEENNVQAAVTVERPATLDLLQRDMKALERALQEAGLKAGPGDLSFSLQGGDPEAFARDFGSGNGSGSGGNGMADGSSAETEGEIAPSSVIATSDGYVDVQV